MTIRRIYLSKLLIFNTFQTHENHITIRNSQRYICISWFSLSILSFICMYQHFRYIKTSEFNKKYKRTQSNDLSYFHWDKMKMKWDEKACFHVEWIEYSKHSLRISIGWTYPFAIDTGLYSCTTNVKRIYHKLIHRS